MTEPNIFKPYILLHRIEDAGIISVHGGGSVNDLRYEISGGQPYQSAYNDAFKLALASQLPLWDSSNNLLYTPNVLRVPS